MAVNHGCIFTKIFNLMFNIKSVRKTPRDAGCIQNLWKGFELHSGNCVLGEPYTGEPRPNFVLYYPDTVRAEYLCSPSRFVVFPITMCYALFLSKTVFLLIHFSYPK
eukprot:8940_1